MADCPSLSQCPFFNDRLENMPNMMNLIKEKFCKGDYEPCARFRVSKAMGREKVPGNLFPQDAQGADRILNKK